MKKLIALVLVLALASSASAALIAEYNFDGATGLEDTAPSPMTGTIVGTGVTFVSDPGGNGKPLVDDFERCPGAAPHVQDHGNRIQGIKIARTHGGAVVPDPHRRGAGPFQIAYPLAGAFL